MLYQLFPAKNPEAALGISERIKLYLLFKFKKQIEGLYPFQDQMNHFSIICIFLSLLIFYPVKLDAQEKQNPGRGKITGYIVDSISGKPIDYASVSLLAGDKEINGTTSNNKGVFVLNNIPDGKYKIIIYFIGYRNSVIPGIDINQTAQVVDLGKISLANTQIKLKEVEVTATTEIVENRIDKIVYNVANDITSQGGAAIDVLKKVPQVAVDIDGNVELQGNSNIRFLINGKPSSIFGNSLADALASIPASQIKSIEAITSPGAKYDAQGTGGIINIILKDNKVKGINGNVNLSVGTRFENGSFNLNLRNNDFGVNAFFSGNAQLSSRTPNSQNRNSSDTSSKTTSYLLQDGYTDFERNGYRAGLGFDWNINKKNNVSGSASYNQFGNSSKAILNQEQYVEDYSSTVLQDVKGYRNSNSNSSVNSMDFNLNYRKSFKKEGQELNLAYVSSYGKPNSNFIQTQSHDGAILPYTGMSSNNPGTDNSNYISLDYIHPINEHLEIETGVKASEQNINSATNVSFLNTTSDQYEVDPLQSFHLKYNMRVYAAYISSSFKLFNWLDVKAGARSEYTDIKIDFPNTTVPSYNIVVPSVIFSHKFKNKNTLKLAYTRRIERPDYSELNPFVNLSDPHNITTGNPSLRPEIGDNSELGYSKEFSNGANIYISLIERINSQDLKQITTFYKAYQVNDSVYSNVSVSKRQNIGTEYNSGVSISGSLPIKEKFKIRINFSATNRYIVSTIYVGDINMGIRYRGNVNLSYQLPKNLIVEAFGNYNSAAKNIQGKNPQSATYTFALRKQFWNKNASFGFTATNPFNKYVKQVTTVTTNVYTSYSIRELPYRSFGISLTYKFGKLEFKKGKEDSSEFLNVAPPSN